MFRPRKAIVRQHRRSIALYACQHHFSTVLIIIIIIIIINLTLCFLLSFFLRLHCVCRLSRVACWCIPEYKEYTETRVIYQCNTTLQYTKMTSYTTNQKVLVIETL
jgi:hypothetical protein